MNAVIIAVILVVAAAVWIIFIFNTLVTLRNRVKNSWAQVEVQLKVRFDLLPNLIETVKGYTAHEKAVIEKVVNARNQVLKATEVEGRSKAESELAGTMKSLFALSEAYPDLKANQNFLQLQEKLTEAEQKIAYARQFYNDTVMKYNTQIEILPNSLFASAMGFKAMNLFELASEEEQKNITVKF